MNWQLLGPLLVTTLVAVGGWFVGHALSVQRDRANKKRDLRVTYLIEAYRRLESCAHSLSPSHSTVLESAIADIQLFGSRRQVELVQAFATDFSEHHGASLDELLRDLRHEIRDELSLQSVSDRIVHLRITDKNEA